MPKKPPPFDRARSVFAHTGPAAEALQSFKYKRNWASGASLAKVFGQGVRGDWLPGQGLLAPVPLHPLRLWQRGFNQALILARGVDKRHGLRLERGLLVRKRHTKPQVGLGPSQRLANVQGAFALKPGLGPMVKGSAVVLVDDVFTTGATAGQCALALREAGASWVGVITLTRAAGAEA